MTGRPSGLSAKLQAEIVELVEAGNLNQTAAEACGVDARTFYNWMRWGKLGEAEGKANQYVAFFQAITRARAQAEVALVRTVRAGDDPGETTAAKTAQWLLERTRGNRYASRVNIKVEEELESLVDVIERVCSSKDCGCHAEILEALAARDRGEEAEAVTGEPAPDIH